MKLKIKTNSGWFAVDCPESEATRHHEDKNEKGCYSESKINSRRSSASR